MNTIIVDGVPYVRTSEPSPVKILILQRSWTVVGYVSEDGDCYVVDRAAVVRRWGTTRGLGQIAMGGPTVDTILDKAGRVMVHKLATVALIDCVPEVWESVL